MGNVTQYHMIGVDYCFLARFSIGLYSTRYSFREPRASNWGVADFMTDSTYPQVHKNDAGQYWPSFSIGTGRFSISPAFLKLFSKYFFHGKILSSL